MLPSRSFNESPRNVSKTKMSYAPAPTKRWPIVWFGLITLCTHLAVSEYSWCDPSLCPGGDRHIACRNDGSFHRRCQPDATLIDISRFKAFFVHEHNWRRNLIASGRIPGYYPAARMTTMQWDDELQYLSELNLRTCILDHDDCYHTYRFKNSGQNLCSVSRLHTQKLNATDIIAQVMHLWFQEYSLIDSSFITSFKVTDIFEDYGHFAEMVVDRNSRVGCGIMRFTRPDYPWAYVYNMVCNYASVYCIDEPVYQRGYPTSKCKTGRNPHYTSMCSTREDYNPNYDFNL